MTRIFLVIASILGGLSVVAGSFASHALKEKFSQYFLDIFQTGARLQMYHSLALLMVAFLLTIEELPQGLMVAAGYAFIIGIVIFSGSLYALSLTGIKWLGAITPIGGIALIIGWGCMAVAGWNLKL
ncbi:MAG: DUF423 domain-containing protein [Okeania sp. SIO2G4]|uniref:DUF423 domain-containing protein n=1 Tax=unclassified Okeania TaxID=2634635 RepID=UPI0013BC541E|nr:MULTISPECIES: DUF423 domain-containing protein [unclassified Okeania]NEP04643.1 DUF423 domain-containing protein [Okeania sp. SIO4D6]NEP47281.1 DUF423 domain-containing protein [Okeania sp. SIO2H7]NEP74057.1 DUF423 domain-containing protein [Okeania sp. SIO2G5]NEP94902.1 DUF423 domain-containing protein [Okeania sp. SIO2F5]NEQ92574.1 DUF423 domain-containing protein [Okeania sp. SIO2G4]